jgi:hypothetical protein
MSNTSKHENNWKEKREKGRTQLTALGVLIFVLFLMLITYVKLWDQYLRMRSVTFPPDQTASAIELTITHPPVVSAEDTGELVMSVKPTDKMITETLDITLTLDLEPHSILLAEEIKNQVVLTDINPHEMYTVKVPFLTTGLMHNGHPITKTLIAVEGQLSSNSFTEAINTLEIPMDVIPPPFFCLYNSNIPGFRKLFSNVKFLQVITTVITAATPTYVFPIIAWFYASIEYKRSKQHTYLRHERARKEPDGRAAPGWFNSNV